MQGGEKIDELVRETEQMERELLDYEREEEEFQQYTLRLKDELKKADERLVQLQQCIGVRKRTIAMRKNELDVVKLDTLSKKQKFNHFKDKVLGLL